MTAYTGGIGGLPPAPPADCDGTPIVPPAPDFLVTYDEGTDTVTVESSVPFFGPDVQAIEIHLDGGANNWLLTDGAQFTTVDSTHITFGNGTAYGLVLESIDFFNDGSQSILRGSWSGSVAFGPPLTYPLIESICSPAPDTIRFVGQRFLTATAGQVGYVITRLADYSNGPPANVLEGPGMQYELADGSPDANGWTLNTHTDNIIEIANPAFTALEPDGGPGDFVVTGAAFHDPTATTMYYYEPWGLSFSTPVDGAGC